MSFKYRRKMSFRHYALTVAIAAFGVIASIFVIVRLTRPKPRMVVVYHGPNPGTILAVAASDSASDKNQSPNVTSIPTTQTHVQDQSVKKVDEYGIAAGGGLVFLSQKDLNQYFESLKSLGVGWVRWDIDWSVVQPNNATNFHWEGTDRVVATAKRHGINSLGIITYTPKWAADKSCIADFGCEPADPKAFGLFAGEVALRYKDSITYWEIWNEPGSAFFSGQKQDAKKYADVLIEAYTEIKKINSQSLIICAAVGITENEQDSPYTFIKTLYTLGANQYFDAVALHPYAYPASPNYKASWNSWQQITSIHQVMIDNGDKAKKIWITEFGAPTGGSGMSYNINQFEGFKYGADFMTESAQQDLATEAINFYRQHMDWMGPFFWYSLKDGGTSRDTPENFFGLLRFDGSKKPAYDVFRNAILSSQ